MTDRHDCGFTASKLCTNGTVEDDQPKPAQTEKPDYLCEPCIRLATRCVEDSPEMWVSLELAIGDRSRRIGERVSGTPSPRININTAVEDVQGRLVAALVLAAARVSEPLGVDDPQLKSRVNAEQARVVQACCRLLRPHIEKLLDSPADSVVQWRKTGESSTWVDKSGIDLAADIVRIHRDARRELGQTKPKYRLTLACPACEAPTLWRSIDKIGDTVRDQVTCSSCNGSWDHSHYQRLITMFVEDEMEAWLNAEKLWQQSEFWRWRVAELEWKMSLAADCTDISAADFFQALEAA